MPHQLCSWGKIKIKKIFHCYFENAFIEQLEEQINLCAALTMFLSLCSTMKSLANSIKGQKKLTNKAKPIKVTKLFVLLFIKTSGMSIRAFLYSRRAEEASAQTQWPSAILLVDNDPDTGTPPISQTSNKARHTLSFSNNIHTAARARTGQHLVNTRGELSSGWTGSNGKHPVYRSGTVCCLMARSWNCILLLLLLLHHHPPNTQRQRLL